MANLNTARLKSQLQTSGLQQKDSALFQVIHSLIGALDTLNRELSSIQSGGGITGDITNIINQISQTSGIGPPGIDGADGDDGALGPTGMPGATGAIGAGGPAGPTTIGPMGIDGVDGDDGMPLPGPQGLQGAIGPIGPAGPTTIGPMGLDGEDGLDGYPIPGRDGTSGSGGSSAWTLIAEQTAAGATQYDFIDLGSYNEIRIALYNLVASGALNISARVSTDNGATFLSATGDYKVVQAAGTIVDSTNITFYTGGAAAGRYGSCIISNFNTTKLKISISGFSDNFYQRFIPTTSPLNAVRVVCASGGTINSGTIYVWGR